MKKILIIIATLFLLSENISAELKDDLIIRPYFELVAPSAVYLPTVDSAVNDARQSLKQLLRDTLDYIPRIYITESLDKFKKLVGSNFPDWGAAAAIPHKKMVVIKSPLRFNVGKSLSTLVEHEYAHLAVQDRLYLNHPPRWLDEGICMYISAEWSWEDNFAMSRASVFGNFIPLRELDRVNSFVREKAHVAYAQSYMAVYYIIETYGLDAFNRLLDGIKDGLSMDQALMISIGGDYEAFEKELGQYLEKRYNILTLLGDMRYLWIFLAILIIVGFIMSLIRRKKGYDRLEEMEEYHSTDFDYGNPDNPEQTDDEDKPWA